MSESKADQLRAEMLERHRAELAAPGWKGLSNEPERHRARGDMDAWCDWCGDCAEDQPCRCCLAAEVEVLRAELIAAYAPATPTYEELQAQVQRVRKVCDESDQNRPRIDGYLINRTVPVKDIRRALEGDSDDPAGT